MGAGYYVDGTHPAYLAELAEPEITRRLVCECITGVGTTGIRAGALGEIGGSWPLTPGEAAVLRAAGAAQRQVGCALFVHPGRNRGAPRELLDLLDGGGVDLNRVVTCHVERNGLRARPARRAGIVGLLSRVRPLRDADDAFFARIGIQLPHDGGRLDQVAELAAGGWGSQVLISHDICSKHRLHRFGGHGYDHISSVVVPMMLERGFTGEDVRGQSAARFADGVRVHLRRSASTPARQASR